MIPQLVERLGGLDTHGLEVLSADPFDLILHMEQVWDAANPTLPSPGRQALWNSGSFAAFGPVPATDLKIFEPAWDHLGYGYVLENTRVVQIFRRVVREYRTGEGLGIPSAETQQWLNTTETLLFGAANPIASWQSTSLIRPDSEAVRRNAYWRLFGLDLAFGGEDNGPPVYDKASAANVTFVSLFEELLFELWQAMSNITNSAGVNNTDDDRIYRIAEQLKFVLSSRRQSGLLRREELAAATALGWADLTLRLDSPLVVDLRAQGTSPGDRLRMIGERVGLPAHSKSAAFFSMAADLSTLLRTIESGAVAGPADAWILYIPKRPGNTTDQQIGNESRRVITEWAAATGKDLKSRGKPVEVSRPRLMAVQ